MRTALVALATVLLAGCSVTVNTGSTPSPAAATAPTPSPAATATAAPTPTPTAIPSPVPSPTSTAAPAPTPTAAPAGYVGLDNCPPYAAGQHPLGSPGNPGVGVRADPTLNWLGCGNVTLPPGDARFLTGDNWQLGVATTCPNELNYGPGGMGTSVTIAEVIPGGAPGPDREEEAGPWTDQGGGLVAHGGNFQLKVTSLDLRCRWHIAVYPAT